MDNNKLNKDINKIEEVECCDLNHEGLGVVKVDNFPFFVSNLLVGEKAKVKLYKKGNNSFGTGEVCERIKNSSDRTEPICSNFYRCGGCDLMHMNYEAQLKFKLKMVNATFKRIGHLDYQFAEIIGADDPYHYRNKVQIPYKKRGQKIVCGFYQKKSHDIIALEKCYIQSDETTNIALSLKDILNEKNISTYNEETGKGLFRHLLLRKTYNNKYMVVLIINDDKKSSEKNCDTKLINIFKEIGLLLKDKYKEIASIILNINSSSNNIILGDKYFLLDGVESLTENILGLSFKMGHKSFFQINHDQTEKLYKKVIEYADISPMDTVLDCYCGVGTISLLCAKKAKKVYGIEIIKEAVINANENAVLNNITNAEFIMGKSEVEMEKYKDVDILICDPPRKGMDPKLIESILNSNIKKLVYVSCDCATMARDISRLQDKYEIIKGATVDLFPQTADVETVCLLKRK